MPFVAGREIDTSICTACYATVKPQSYQTLAQAESEHACGVRPAARPMPPKAPQGIVKTPAPILLEGSWRSISMPDWEACTFRFIQAENEESTRAKRAEEPPPDTRKLLP